MLTPEQEQYLATFADKGLAEQAEIAARNATIEQETARRQAREAKLAELQTEAHELVEKGMREFNETMEPAQLAEQPLGE